MPGFLSYSVGFIPRNDAWGYGPDDSCNGCNNIWAHVFGHANEGISSRGRVCHYAPIPTERSCPKIHTIIDVAEHVQMYIDDRLARSLAFPKGLYKLCVDPPHTRALRTPGISSSAHWIWTHDHDAHNDVFCRFTMSAPRTLAAFYTYRPFAAFCSHSLRQLCK